MRVFIYMFVVIMSLPLKADEVVKYRVVKGDTLSGILFKLNIGPIYGDKGLRKLSAKMNGLTWNGNNLKIGDELVFPATLVNQPVEASGPKVEEPKVEEPKVEEPKIEEPKAPVVVTPVPVVAPVVLTPVAVVPVTEDKSPEEDIPQHSYVFVEIKEEDLKVPDPLPKAVADVENDQPQHHSFRVTPQVSLLNLTSESADTFQHSDLEIYTRPIPGAQLQYNLHWDEHWSFLIFANLSRVSFYPDDNVVYNRTSVSRNSYGFGTSLKEGKAEWAASLGLHDELFFSLPSTTQVKVQVVALPEMVVSYRNLIKEKKKLSLKYGLNAKAILPYETPEIKADLGYGGGLELLLGSARRNFRLFYNYAQANARDHQTNSSEIGLGFIMEGHFYE